MNQVSQEEKKESLTKVFAIVGFIAIVIFAVWLAVRIVSFIPGAFSSLASLADSVYNYDNQQELVVATKNTVINAGEATTITWTKMNKEGTYSFVYKCTDGVALDAKNSNGEIVSVACDTPLLLNDKTSLEVLVASEKARFVDVTYTISFAEKDTTESAVSTTKTITIVNVKIPTSGLVTDSPETVTETPTETVTTPPTKTPTYVAGTPTTVKKIIYTIPVSDPNGKIDLAVTFLGTGKLKGNVFTHANEIDVDENGAIQFEIKNIGTKTTESWNYTAQLPSDISYTSPTQKALKPNERAIITLGFEGVTRVGTEKISVSVDAKNDVNKLNDKFTWSVKIVK